MENKIIKIISILIAICGIISIIVITNNKLSNNDCDSNVDNININPNKRHIVKTVWEDDSNEEDICKLQIHSENDGKKYDIPELIKFKIKYSWNGKKITNKSGLIQYKDSLFLGCSPTDFTPFVFKNNHIQVICDGIVYSFDTKEYKDKKFYRFDNMYIIPNDIKSNILGAKNVIIYPDTDLVKEIIFIN